MGFTQKMLDAINNARNSMISGINSPNPTTGAMGMGGGGSIANSARVYGVDPSLLAGMTPSQIASLHSSLLGNSMIQTQVEQKVQNPDIIFSANVQVHKVSNGYTVKFDNARRSEIYIADNLAKVHDILVSHMTAQRLES